MNYDLLMVMRLIADNSPDLLWAKDMDNRFIFVNQAMCDKLLMCGNPDNAIGKTDLFFAESERKSGYKHTFGEQCVNSDKIIKESKTPRNFLEEGYVRGNYLTMDVYKAPFFNDNGEIIGTVGYGRNITSNIKTEEDLKKSRKQLYQAQKMEALGALVSGVAHEINNPINLIIYNIPIFEKVWSDLLPVLKERAGKEKDRKYGGLTFDFLKENFSQLLSDMKMAANHIAKIVTDLKNFSRQPNLTDKEPIQLNTAVKSSIRLTKTTFKKAGIKLEIDLADNLPLLEGNLQNIEQIILNILINGIQAIDHDHGKIKIATGMQSKDGFIYISISDNGTGVDPSIADKLFDPFVTSKQAEGGTGLGLSITYSLIKAHNGEITFRRREGNGTVFTISFPTKIKEKGARILIVDDDMLIRDLLKEVLTKKQPYFVEEAANGIEACIKLGTYKPDLLILDMFMPEMDGLEVCRNIKTNPDLSNIKVIISTGHPNHSKLKQAAELGFTNIFYKPFNLEDFLKEIKNVLTV